MPYKGNAARAAVRRLKAIELRMEGKTYSKIAEEIGVSKRQAYLDVKRAIKEAQDKYTEDGKTYITMDLRRMDKMLAALWEGAKAGDTASVDRVLKIMERKHKLLGLDAPQKKQLTGELVSIEIKKPKLLEDEA